MARLSQLFAPREREFFDLFEEAGANIVRAAELLERIIAEWPDNAELQRDVVVCEQEGDRITHDIIQRLNSTFVTPIDREDIYALASALDDIVDFIEETADFMSLYRIEAPMDKATEMAKILHQSSRAVAGAIPRLRTFKDTTTTPSRSTGSRTTATGCCARRSRRCSSGGSTRCS
jgi:predicted phosphate transport protein (TIGR00153 family)